MKLEHLILAKESSVDVDKNTLSIFDIVEQLTIRGEKPTSSNVGVSLQLIAVFKRDKEVGNLNGSVEIQVLDPNDKVCLKENVAFRVDSQHNRTRLRINLILPIKAAGVYRVIADGMGAKAETDVIINYEKIFTSKEAKL